MHTHTHAKKTKKKQHTHIPNHTHTPANIYLAKGSYCQMVFTKPYSQHFKIKNKSDYYSVFITSRLIKP